MRSITERYGVEPPLVVLRRRLVERLGEEEAAALMAAYQEAARRYQRAVRVDTARYHLERWRGLRPAHIERQYARWRLLVDHADDYIAGAWRMPRRVADVAEEPEGERDVE